MTKLKNSNFDKTQKLKLSQNSKKQIETKIFKNTQSVTKLKKNQIVMKIKNSICAETPKTQIVMKLKNTNCDETQKLKW